jgi:hypothetical protein
MSFFIADTSVSPYRPVARNTISLYVIVIFWYIRLGDTDGR